MKGEGIGHTVHPHEPDHSKPDSRRIPSRLCASGVPGRSDSGVQSKKSFWGLTGDAAGLLVSRRTQIGPSFIHINLRPRQCPGPSDKKYPSGLGVLSTCSGLTDASRRWLRVSDMRSEAAGFSRGRVQLPGYRLEVRSISSRLSGCWHLGASQVSVIRVLRLEFQHLSRESRNPEALLCL